MQAVEKLSLPETVYRELRSAIVAGAFKPGEMLRQDDLAHQLGVSRAPLREALPRLEAEGLVVLSPRRGYAVARLNPAEIEEIFLLRASLEREILQMSAKRRGPADIRRVAEMLDAVPEDVDTADVEDMRRWSNAHHAFHNALLIPSQMSHGIKMVEGLRSIVEPYIRTEIAFTGGLAQANAEHATMFRYFADGDGRKLAELMRKHCLNTAQRLLEGLAAEDQRDS